MTEDDTDNLFIHIVAKLLASGTDNDDDDNNDAFHCTVLCLHNLI